jgi:hypothetical protein
MGGRKNLLQNLRFVLSWLQGIAMEELRRCTVYSKAHAIYVVSTIDSFSQANHVIL